MTADTGTLASWYQTAAPDSIAGRFRIAMRQAAGQADGSKPAAPAATPPEVTTSADPRLAGLRSWRELSAFLDGYARGRDPEGTDADGTIHSTRRSLWIGSKCDICGHSFRNGDVVLVRHGEDGGPGTVVHRSADFPCADVPVEPCDPGRASAADSTVEQFAAAVARFFPLRPGLAVLRLTDRHCRLAEAYVENRRTCMQCGHTVRIGDRIVRCPCGLPKKACTNVVHHDPAQGFPCYMAWTQFDNWRQRCANPAGSATSHPDPGVP
jgi:hypothetical protein